MDRLLDAGSVAGAPTPFAVATSFSAAAAAPPAEGPPAVDAVTRPTLTASVPGGPIAAVSEAPVVAGGGPPRTLFRQASLSSISSTFDGGSSAPATPLPHVERSPQGNFLKYSEILGKGAFKVVFKGQDVNDGKLVAWNEVNIKTYSKKERERILFEIRLLRTLKHPHLLAYYGGWVNKETEKVVFVTEIMSSGTLRDFCGKYPVQLKAIKRYCREILECIAYLHAPLEAQAATPTSEARDAKPVLIHRDLKCDNIFIMAQGKGIKIGDLGLVTANDGKSVMGTPNFMAPGACRYQ